MAVTRGFDCIAITNSTSNFAVQDTSTLTAFDFVLQITGKLFSEHTHDRDHHLIYLPLMDGEQTDAVEPKVPEGLGPDCQTRRLWQHLSKRSRLTNLAFGRSHALHARGQSGKSHSRCPSNNGSKFRN